jgi:RsiW-degrading membrane proteinase PrsW (M82 family)
MDWWLIGHAAIGLFPVLSFLGALLALDSYKLVRLPVVLAVIGAGGLCAGLAYLANAWAITRVGLDFSDYARYVAPAVEECAKALVILALVRSHRIGFLVDASVFGFAVGTGFAMIENLYYLNDLAGANMGVWIVRGFGTAILHGGVQAIFAAMLLANTDRRGKMDLAAIVPPLVVATAVHSAFNHFVLPPVPQTMLVLVVLPPLMLWVFTRSEKAVESWIGQGFDTDRELLELLESGAFGESPAGQFLHGLRAHFPGEVVADLVCMLRLHAELALRAKGVLMMRDNGIELPEDPEVREKFGEMRYLERNVGRTALRTIKPLLHMSRRDLWQLYMLGK